MADANRDVIGWLSEHPLVDVGVAFVVVVGHDVLIENFHKGAWLSWIDSSQRVGVYGTGAVVVSVLGGLAALGVATSQASSGPRAQAVRRLYGREMRRNWRSLLLTTGVAALLCMVAQALDGAVKPLVVYSIFEFAMILWLAQFVRLIWLLDATFAIADADQTEKRRVPAPPRDPRWGEERNAG